MLYLDVCKVDVLIQNECLVFSLSCLRTPLRRYHGLQHFAGRKRLREGSSVAGHMTACRRTWP